MTYADYRKHHGVFASFTLSVNPWLWMGTAAAIGVIAGLLLR
ncbi:hypothetical protein [Mesorhizobium sp. AR07]|nr:hypothetical protein [Mesorhizobium sp. AR07]